MRRNIKKRIDDWDKLLKQKYVNGRKITLIDRATFRGARGEAQKFYNDIKARIEELDKKAKRLLEDISSNEFPDDVKRTKNKTRIYTEERIQELKELLDD